MRLKMQLAYDGTEFHGWAEQPGLRTVQGVLQDALKTALRVPVQVACAGRTDTGVHARGQVVHFDVAEDVLLTAAGRAAQWPVAALANRLNGILAADVRVRELSETVAEFDARFAALWRAYRYRIADRPAAVDPLTRGFVLSWSRQLDEVAMNLAAKTLLGEHDFATYCKRREGATTIRQILDFSVSRNDFELIEVSVKADAFCYHMVRSLVGALVAVGEGRRPVAWPRQMLDARQRSSEITMSPARGLTLEAVGYPPDADFAARVIQTRAMRTAEVRDAGVGTGETDE